MITSSYFGIHRINNISVKLWHIYTIKCEFINFKCLVEYNFHNSRNLCEILFVKDNIPFKVYISMTKLSHLFTMNTIFLIKHFHSDSILS